MDHFQQTKKQFRLYSFGLIAGSNILSFACAYAVAVALHLPTLLSLLSGAALGTLFAWIGAGLITNYVSQPLQALWQVILHLNPSEHGTPAPDTASLKVGQELVTSLTGQIYQLSSVAERAATEQKQLKADLHRNFIAQNLPLPLIVLDATETIVFANDNAAQYIGIASEDMLGKNVYMVLDMSFPSTETFDVWLKQAKINNAVAVGSWERVRLNVRDNHPTRLFDLAAYYNRDNPERNETMLVLFDHTKQYSQDEQAISYVALSVHELRTPLTLLRGYIEVFEDELTDKIDPELQSFMQKMQSQAEQLTAFVNNILNVARIEDDQLELHLQSGDWPTILKSAIDGISIRAAVRDISLQCSIQRNMPPVGVDSLSIREVVNNLIDNAIKYSGQSKVIQIRSFVNQEGLIETNIQDFGLGITTSIMPNLFTKFYRDHHNRAQIGGTGLGLFLSKTIIEAHGGSIWVRSKEGEGSIFGFTLIPYTQLTEDIKQGDDQEITRGAHGWIKNHSLYRR